MSILGVRRVVAALEFLHLKFGTTPPPMAPPGWLRSRTPRVQSAGRENKKWWLVMAGMKTRS